MAISMGLEANQGFHYELPRDYDGQFLERFYQLDWAQNVFISQIGKKRRRNFFAKD